MSRPSNLLAATAVLFGVLGLVLPSLIPVPRSISVALVVSALLLLLMAIAYRRHPRPACATASPQLQRRYTRELVTAMAAYVLVLSASVWLLVRVESLPARVLLALAPVLPIGFAVRAMVRHVRGIDEMQQRIELEAISVATVAVSMLYMTGGFLQSANLIHVPGAVAMLWVFPLICFSYGLAKAFVARRYQ